MTPCLVCADDVKRTEAARRFAAGESLRAVAEAIGVSKSALDRCKRNHALGQAIDGEGCPSHARDNGSFRKSSPEKSTAADETQGASREGVSSAETPCWRTVAPMIRYLMSDGTPATAQRGEVVTDLHSVFAAALERVGAVRRA